MPTDVVLDAESTPADRNFNKQESWGKEMVQGTKSCHANLKTGVQIPRTHTQVLWAWQTVTPALWGQRQGIPRASWLARPLGSSKLQVERERKTDDRQTDRQSQRDRERQRRETDVASINTVESN